MSKPGRRRRTAERRLQDRYNRSLIGDLVVRQRKLNGLPTKPRRTFPGLMGKALESVDRMFHLR